MRVHVFLACVLAGAVAVGAVTAGEPPRLVKSADLQKADRPRENTAGLLATLERRCQKMLAVQIAVFDAAKDLDKTIAAHADQKPSPQDQNTARKLSSKQKAIIVEASRCLVMLKAEAAAVAFLEVFAQVHADLKRIQRRLEMGDVGSGTQAIALDVIETLKEMVGALR